MATAASPAAYENVRMEKAERGAGPRPRNAQTSHSKSRIAIAVHMTALNVSSARVRRLSSTTGDSVVFNTSMAPTEPYPAASAPAYNTRGKMSLWEAEIDICKIQSRQHYLTLRKAVRSNSAAEQISQANPRIRFSEAAPEIPMLSDSWSSSSPVA